MDKYWTADFIVNNPFNEIDKADRIRKGTVTYASFQRICEAARIHDNVAVLMGKEIVVPKGKSPDAGKNNQPQIHECLDENKWTVENDCSSRQSDLLMMFMIKLSEINDLSYSQVIFNGFLIYF